MSYIKKISHFLNVFKDYLKNKWNTQDWTPFSRSLLPACSTTGSESANLKMSSLSFLGCAVFLKVVHMMSNFQSRYQKSLRKQKEQWIDFFLFHFFCRFLTHSSSSYVSSTPLYPIYFVHMQFVVWHSTSLIYFVGPDGFSCNWSLM